ncbi:MAG: recombinase RecA [Bdellovibrionota bacterium]
MANVNQAAGPKAKALDLAIQSIEKQFGKGSIMRLGNGQNLHDGIQAIPTGSLSLDLALGIGGIPKGRVIEIYGPESSGKTTLALTSIAECQKQGGTAAFVDAEHALDVEYARKLGVDVDALLISQPDTGEQALEIVDMLIKSSAVDILVVDSVAALVPRAELEGDMGDHQMGAQARLMSQALRKLTGSISKSKSTVIFINQIRMKIGVMFGNPETTTGGNALKFYASVRMDVRRIAAIKNGDDVIGNRTRVKVVKNKVSPPFKEVEFDILYGKGICKEGDLLDLGATLNVIEKSGTWYSYSGERLGQGRDAARETLKANPKMLNEIREKVLKMKGILNRGAVVSNPAEPVAANLEKADAKEAKAETKAEPASKHESKAHAAPVHAKSKKMQ